MKTTLTRYVTARKSERQSPNVGTTDLSPSLPLPAGERDGPSPRRSGFGHAGGVRRRLVSSSAPLAPALSPLGRGEGEDSGCEPAAVRAAFTLLELCVVLATVALLALTLLPVLASTRPNTQSIRCLNNLRQLAAAWAMYPADNNGSVMHYTGWVGYGGDSWMDWTANPANTNTAPLLTNLMGNYVRSAALFKCPADQYPGPIGPRARSVSLNGALGSSGPVAYGTNPGGRRYYAKNASGVTGAVGRGVQKMSELNRPGPARTFLILDEHPDSINDGLYMFDPGRPQGQERWRDLPASYHNGGAGISFADGHTEMHKWIESSTLIPVLRTYYPSDPPWKLNIGISRDVEWVQDGMPWRE
jgi:prepilin-type processing-associated H-X9-DG protein